MCTHNSRDPLPKVVIVMMALFEAMYPNQMQISRALALNRRADRDTLSLKGGCHIVPTRKPVPSRQGPSASSMPLDVSLKLPSETVQSVM